MRWARLLLALVVWPLIDRPRPQPLPPRLEVAARRCVECRFDHPPRLSSVRCPWCGKPTFPVAGALPTDDGLDRHDRAVLAWREELDRLVAVAARRGLTLVDLIDVRDPAVPPAET